MQIFIPQVDDLAQSAIQQLQSEMAAMQAESAKLSEARTAAEEIRLPLTQTQNLPSLVGIDITGMITRFGDSTQAMNAV